MTSVLGACGPPASTARNSFSGPERSSASNHPPMKSAAGVMLCMCGRKRAGRPEFVVSGVRQVVVPVGILVLEILFVAVGERSHAQVEVVLVGRAEIEGDLRRRAGRFQAARLEAGIEAEVRGQIERAVVIGVVAVADVAHGSLRRCGFQRRMRIDHARTPRRIRDRRCP